MKNELTKEEKELCEKGNHIVRRNLLEDINYRPYCGNDLSRDSKDGCYNPRTYLRPDGQFICPHCKYVTQFPQEFVEVYKKKHNIN